MVRICDFFLSGHKFFTAAPIKRQWLPHSLESGLGWRLPWPIECRGEEGVRHLCLNLKRPVASAHPAGCCLLVNKSELV